MWEEFHAPSATLSSVLTGRKIILPSGTRETVICLGLGPSVRL